MITANFVKIFSTRRNFFINKMWFSFFASLNSIGTGKLSLFRNSVGSTTTGRKGICYFVLNGLHHNGHITVILCLNGFYH